MKAFKLPYMKYLVSPPHAKKAQYVCRPVVPVTLSFRSRMITFDALVDSGADECTFPAWIAKTLGRDLHEGRQRIFSGIGGSVLAYLHRTRLNLKGTEFVVNVYYSHDWDDMPFGLLGQAAFFSRFDIAFSYADKSIRFRQR